MKLIAPDAASPQEAAAIVAALERFMRATAPLPAPSSAAIDRWQQAALAEGLERAAGTDPADPWINT